MIKTKVFLYCSLHEADSSDPSRKNRWWLWTQRVSVPVPWRFFSLAGNLHWDHGAEWRRRQTQVDTLILPLAMCVTLGTVFNCSEPRCPHLESGKNDVLFSSLTEFLWRSSEIMMWNASPVPVHSKHSINTSPCCLYFLLYSLYLLPPPLIPSSKLLGHFLSLPNYFPLKIVISCVKPLNSYWLTQSRCLIKVCWIENVSIEPVRR